jgi:DNA-directed RNA polymerase subunit RPC12/RpoP
MPPAFFVCENCQTKYQHEPSLAGHAIRCKMCGFIFRVPPVPVASAPPIIQAPPVAGSAAPQASGTGRWFLRLPNGRQFGPVQKQMVAGWVAEGRADGESWLLQEGTADWMQLKQAFPDLAPATGPAEEDPYDPIPLGLTQIPASGLLDYLQDENSLLSSREQQNHAEACEMLRRECQRTMGVVRIKGWKSVRVGEKVVFGESIRLPMEAKPESLTIVALSSQSAEFDLVIPWSKLGRLPHEFVSILPGMLPSSIALRRKRENAFDGGLWVGISGTEQDVLAVAARRSQEDLAKGIRWQWYSQCGNYTMILVWGLQAVPLGSEKFIHIMQTTPMGPNNQDFGILWYLERQSAFYRFARRLSIPHDHETHFLFSTSAGQLFAGLSGWAPPLES